MNVFVAGATGVLGRRIVDELTDRGHEVVGLTRDERGDKRVREAGGTPRRGDVLDRESLREAVAEGDADAGGDSGADVIVHAATAIPTKQKPTAEDWKRNDRVRREGAENLTEVASEVDAERFLQASIVWVARQPDGSRFDETAEPNPDRTTQSALDAERIVREAGESGATQRGTDAQDGFDPVVLRCGFFYAHDAAHTRTFGEELLAGNMPIVGGGLLGREDAELSLLHADDAATAFAAAIEGDATGVYHVVDDEPVTTADLLRAFADRLNAPEPRRIPGWLAKYLAGEDTVRLMTRPMPTSAEQFRRDFDWEPSYPTYREGLDAVVEQWVEDGTLTGSTPEQRTDRTSDASPLADAPEGYEWRGGA